MALGAMKRANMSLAARCGLMASFIGHLGDWPDDWALRA